MARNPTSTYRSSITPDHDRQETIKARAYQLWEESGYVHGQDQQHWRQAEDELTDETSSDRTIDNVTQISGQHRDGISDLIPGNEKPKVPRRVSVSER